MIIKQYIVKLFNFFAFHMLFHYCIAGRAVFEHKEMQYSTTASTLQLFLATELINTK
jgi:hypothetical protein